MSLKPLSPPVLFLMGPTASGKTALALELFERFNTELVSVDSALIYRDMNIGTAKPSPAELMHAPHHLIDIYDPTESYSAGRFRQDALALIAAIHTRGKTPLLVGGTMLYFKALQDGIAVLPEQDPDIRKQIEAEAALHGWPALHQKLIHLDPVSAAKIKPTDQQRIGRALEVFYISGTPLSVLQQTRREDSPLPHHIIPFALFPEERQVLHERIQIRTKNMLKQGLIEEVLALREKYPPTADLPSMRSVGYRQVWQYLEGKLTREELEDKIIFATRQYAKRQLTWLKPWPHLHRFDLAETEQIIAAIKAILS